MMGSTHRVRIIIPWRDAALVSPLLLLLAGMLGITAGCQDGNQAETGEVYGTVTLDGDPLPHAQVQFQPEEGGRPSIGRTDKKGRYELRFNRDRNGALLGKHRVRISTKDTVDDGEIPEQVPARYNLKADRNPEMLREVEPGRTKINFELTTSGNRSSGK